MKAKNILYYSLFVAVLCLTLVGISSVCNASPQDVNSTEAVTATPIPVQVSSSPAITAFVSDINYKTAVLSCNIPEILRGSDFVVGYEYWTNDDKTDIVRTNEYRTYNKDNFAAVDSYEVFKIKANTKYYFRAVLTVKKSDSIKIEDTIFSDVVTFQGKSYPTAPPSNNEIYGYVAPDFKTTSKIERGGFKVSINGGAAEVTTDSTGYFSFDTTNCKTVFYNIKISKPGYVERNIDIGYLWDSNKKVANISQNGAYTLMMTGDLNSDETVNMIDIMQIARSFNTKKDSIGYNEVADINGDGVVNMSDIMITANNFNKTGRDYSTAVQIPYIELRSPAKYVYSAAHYKDNNPLTFKLYGSNLKNISGYKININYNPNVIQVIDSSLNNTESDDVLLVNPIFNPVLSVNNDLQNCTIALSKSYTNITDYKNSGVGESTGKMASINFKCGKYVASSFDFIKIYATPDLPTGASYTDWDNTISDIEVLQPHIYLTYATQ